MASKKKGARRRLPSRKGILKRLEKSLNKIAKEKTGTSFTEARKARKPRGGSRKGKGRKKAVPMGFYTKADWSKSSQYQHQARKRAAKGRKRNKKGQFVKSRKK